MTPNKENYRTDSVLEGILDALTSDIGSLVSMTQGIYDRVDSIQEQTDSLYDMITYQKDVPVFDPDEYAAA